jgi:membrane protease YdiL (CAAX protease family)
LVAAGAAVVLASLAYIVAPLFSSTESARARDAYGTHRDVLANTVSAIAVGNLVLLPLLLLITAGPELWRKGLGAVLTDIVERGAGIQAFVVFLALVGLDMALLLVVYLRVLRTGATTEREIGLVGSRLLRNVVVGVAGVFAVLLVSGVISYVLTQLGVQQTQAEQLAIRGASPSVFALLFAAGALLAPLAEEIFFRGYVFRAYLTRMGMVGAYVVSSLLFAVLHLNLAAFVPLFFVGLILAYLYHRTGSLVPAIVTHGLNNAIALLAVYYAPGFQ